MRNGISRSHYLVLSIAVMMFVGACAGVQTDRELAYERANAYLSRHPNTAPRSANAIRGLDLVKGMTQAEVRAAWGDPINIEKSINRTAELWYFGCDFPHFCRGSGRRRGRAEEDRSLSRAHFVNKILTEWQN